MLRQFAESIEPDPYISFDVWAEKEFILPKESSKEYGPYRISRTPFVREVLQELSPQSPANEIVVVKPTQLAGTTIAIIFLFGIAKLYPGPTLFLTVTERMAKRFSKKRIKPSLDAMKCMEGVIQEPKSRKSGNTILEKEFPGGSWFLGGSNAAANYRMESAKYVILDDFDGFEMDIEAEGDPGELADRRTGSFGSDCKIYKNSTPTIKGMSAIEAAYEETSQGQFNVPCPHCKQLQYLQIGDKEKDTFGLKFTRDKRDKILDAWYVCEHCHERIDEHHKPWMLENGEYVHKYPERNARGFKWNAILSPMGWKYTWKVIAKKFVVAAKALKVGNPEKMKVFYNTILAESWEERGERPIWTILKARSEGYSALTIPNQDIKFLTAGVDVQKNRLVLLILGWGKMEECWVIYAGEIFGNPLHNDVWNQLNNFLNRSYLNANGEARYIMSMGVDTGGLHTHEVYYYCRQNQPKAMAMKGSTEFDAQLIKQNPRPQDINLRGKTIKNGVLLWMIGTAQAKTILYNRLQIIEPGPNFIHFPAGLEDEFYKQLVAEKLISRIKKGKRAYEFIKMRERNDFLDTWVYAYAAANRLGIVNIGQKTRERRRPIVHKKKTQIRRLQPKVKAW